MTLVWRVPPWEHEDKLFDDQASITLSRFRRDPLGDCHYCATNEGTIPPSPRGLKQRFSFATRCTDDDRQAYNT